MNIPEKTCNVKLYGHIITVQCSIVFIQNTTSRNTNSAVFNRIAWHQIYHFIIKVQCIKLGNILSGVIKQWRSQVIIQVTWEKEVVFIFDDIIIAKYAEAKFKILPVPIIIWHNAFYQHRLTLILAWISNYIHYKLRNVINYPLEWINSCWACVYKSILGLKLIYVNKGPRWQLALGLRNRVDSEEWRQYLRNMRSPLHHSCNWHYIYDMI